jgi:hypothetical protein
MFGVPQGSILGLFLIFINNKRIPNNQCCPLQMLAFADDIKRLSHE